MKKEIQKELEEIAPLLANLKEQPEGYTVPKHFFNNMRIDIMNKVQTEAQPLPAETTKTPWWTSVLGQIQSLLQPKMAIGFATLLLAFVGVFYFFKPDNTVENAINIVHADEQKEIQNAQNQDVIKNETPEVKKQPESIVKIENPIQPVPEVKNQESIAAIEPIASLKLEDASDAELDAIFDELLENEEISEEEISEEIR
jgi:hypothetical protein